jgi:hypothetical protein
MKIIKILKSPKTYINHPIKLYCHQLPTNNRPSQISLTIFSIVHDQSPGHFLGNETPATHIHKPFDLFPFPFLSLPPNKTHNS